MDSLDSVMLILDDLVDDGIPLELDPQLLVQRSSSRQTSTLRIGGIESELPAAFNEESVQQVLGKARDFARNFLK